MGRHHTEESKEKIRTSRLKYLNHNPYTSEIKKRMSIGKIKSIAEKGFYWTGRHLTAKHKKNLSDSVKRCFDSNPEVKRKVICAPRKHQKNTDIELKIQKELSKENIRFKTEVFELPGTPDVFIESSKLCIFADGDYWHNLENVKNRDISVNKRLSEMGYRVLRFWEHDIHNNLHDVILKIKCNLNRA